MKKTVLNLILILVISMQYTNATTYYINHNGPTSTINYQPGDVLEFYASMDGEYTANTTNGSIVPFTYFNAGTLVGTYTLTGNETMASITLRIPTGMPLPAQPYTFLPTIVTLVASCNVTIPDVNFKAYLVGNTAINTNGNTEIECTEAASFTGGIYCSSLGITDLTGIEAFTSLTALICNNNQLTSLNLNSNTLLSEIFCQQNQLTNLDLSLNSALTQLGCWLNQLTSLNVSNNVNLTSLDCSMNQLTSLNVANGNNTNFTTFYTTNNPNLSCIQIDDADTSGYNWTGTSFIFDSGVGFSLDCSAVNGIEEEALNTLNIYPNPSKGNVIIQSYFPTSISLVELNGTVLLNQELIGSIQVDLSQFASGIYIVRTEEGQTIKLIKE